jgi:hypothetical protein
MFSASTALLPSSFVMYSLTLAAAAVIDSKPLLVVVHAVLGVILGWIVAGALAFASLRAGTSVFVSCWLPVCACECLL